MDYYAVGKAVALQKCAVSLEDIRALAPREVGVPAPTSLADSAHAWLSSKPEGMWSPKNINAFERIQKNLAKGAEGVAGTRAARKLLGSTDELAAPMAQRLAKRLGLKQLLRAV